MIRGLLMELGKVAVFLVLITMILAWSGADLLISSLFSLEGKWAIGLLFPWRALYQLDRVPAIALALFGLGAFAGSFFCRSLVRWRRSGAFLVLLMVLGPGLIVNVVFKDHWGRPRPREIVEFGGKKRFLQPWQMGLVGEGRSFPSGHASAAFYLTAPYFIYRRKNSRLAVTWLIGGCAFGVFMSIARITQGGHFLTDTIWAWGMVHITALLLSYLLGLESETSSPPAADPDKCST